MDVSVFEREFISFFPIYQNLGNAFLTLKIPGKDWNAK